MRSNRRERRGENKRESGEGGEGEKEREVGGEKKKRRARTDSRVLALRRAGTLAPVQALVCVGSK